MRQTGLYCALSAALLAASGCLASDSAELDECIASAAATSFLQVAVDLRADATIGKAHQARHRHRSKLRKAIYQPGGFYGLDHILGPHDKPRHFQVVRDELGKCFMSIPNVSEHFANGDWIKVEEEPVRSNFAFGDCPTVFPRNASVFLDLRLDSELDGINASGYNPSLVDLPDRFKQAFPDGRWLALIRSGKDQCPRGAEVAGRMISSVVAVASQPVNSLFGVPADGVDHAASDAVLASPALMRTWVAVLDADMRTLARSDVRMLNGQSVYDDISIVDARLFQMRNGDFLIGFIPYNWQSNPYTFMWNDTWWFHEIVGKLEVGLEPPPSLNGPWEQRPTSTPQIFAWVDRFAARDLLECPEQGLNAPGPKKNLGFFEDDRGVHAVDWIYPTRLGLVNVEGLVADNELKGKLPGFNGAGHIDKLCFGYEENAPNVVENPWADIMYQDWTGMKKSHLHNGPGLLYVPEAQLYLGVGHMHRGYSTYPDPHTKGYVNYGKFGHHYTHQFYALNATAPYALVAVSSEFCFESRQKTGDCESIQFVSSLSRDKSQLLVGYGVMDCEGYVARLDLAEVLRLLKPVA